MIRFLPALLALACGCPHQPERQPPPLDAIADGLDLGAMLAGELATEAREPGGCVAAIGIAQAAEAGAAVVRSRGQLMPAISLDVERCGLDHRAVEVPGWVGPVVSVGLLAARQGASLAPCPDRAYPLAAIEYLTGAHAAIVGELSQPDGVIEIAAVEVSPCE